jgi:hypothetical protein
MAKTVVGLLDSRDQAEKVVDELLKNGFQRRDISLITAEKAVMRDMGKGALVGGLAGLLAGAALLMIPGIGWVAVAGPLATMLAGTAAGTLAGGMIGALTSKGIPEGDAHFFAEGVRRGGTLITVHAETDALASRAEALLKRHGALDIRERSEQWKREGWSGRFDEQRKPAEQEDEEAVPMAAVCVYAFEIENLFDEYQGPERRTGSGAYSGMERRKAA